VHCDNAQKIKQKQSRKNEKVEFQAIKKAPINGAFIYPKKQWSE
jgi:hypothetical protein